MLRRMPPGAGEEGEGGGEDGGALALEPSPEAAAAGAALPETLDSPTAGPAPLSIAEAAAAAAAAEAEDGDDDAMLAAPIGSAPLGGGGGGGEAPPIGAAARGGAGGRGGDDLPPVDTLPEHRIQAGCTAVVAVLQARPRARAAAGLPRLQAAGCNGRGACWVARRVPAINGGRRQGLVGFGRTAARERCAGGCGTPPEPARGAGERDVVGQRGRLARGAGARGRGRRAERGPQAGRGGRARAHHGRRRLHLGRRRRQPVRRPRGAGSTPPVCALERAWQPERRAGGGCDCSAVAPHRKAFLRPCQ